MEKKMSDEEFINYLSIEPRRVHETNDILDSKGIKGLKARLKYVEENYDRQYYMYFALKEVSETISLNFSQISDKFIFKKTDVDNLLRAFCFAIELLPEELPEHAFGYMKNKSSTFLYNLMEQYEQQGISRY